MKASEPVSGNTKSFLVTSLFKMPGELYCRFNSARCRSSSLWRSPFSRAHNHPSRWVQHLGGRLCLAHTFLSRSFDRSGEVSRPVHLNACPACLTNFEPMVIVSLNCIFGQRQAIRILRQQKEVAYLRSQTTWITQFLRDRSVIGKHSPVTNSQIPNGHDYRSSSPLNQPGVWKAGLG